jgi:hypothetical protein
MSILTKKTSARGTPFWKGLDGKEYGRVNIGMMWPGKHPGFAVVLGEDEFKNHELHRYVLAEIEEPGLKAFIRSCYDLAGLYAVSDIYGDRSDKVANDFLRRFNDELHERREVGFHILSSPMFNSPECFELCARTIQKHTEADAKTLHFGEKSRLPAYLLELRPSELKTATAADHPAIAALGFALTPMDIWPSFDPEEMKPQRQVTNYDVYGDE